MPRLAAIDVGSNALRLRIVDVERPSSDGPLRATELVARRAPVRLGHDVFITGRLRTGVISSAIEALAGFRAEIAEARVDAQRAVATSAVREAENGDVFVERAQREAGVSLEIIEGVEEARLVQLAVSRRVRLAGKRALLIDIGGGSTELSLLEGDELRASQSLPVGTVRLLESFLEEGAPVDEPHMELLREYVARALAETQRELRGCGVDLVAATGGTIETLSALCPAGGDEPGIDVRRLGKLIRELASVGVKERMKRWGLREDRADTILPAALVLEQLVEGRGKSHVLAPNTGLRDGILEDLADAHFARRSPGGEDDAVIRACLRLGRPYSFDEEHGLHVARLAGRLFDDLQKLHRLDARDRTLLRAASVLHDVGDFIRYDGHHKHSWYIIQHSDLMGVTPKERSVVANVARYHRKSFPDPSHDNFRELDKPDRAKVRALAAILRLADALDREHRQKVADVRGEIRGDKLRLEVDGVRDKALELWTVARKAELFRMVFALELELVEAHATDLPGTPRAS